MPATPTSYQTLYEDAVKAFNFAAPYAKAWGLSEAELNIPEEEG
jgi:hypothetical protein